MNNTDRALDWGNLLFLVLSPIAALAGGLWYTHLNGFNWMEISLFIVMFLATGLSITGGYHRHFAHKSYHAHPLVRLSYLVFGACAMQNSALHWAADHRLHHRYTDTDKDPYSAGRGFWYSHIGWIFYKSPASRDFTIVGDLLRDPFVRWQHRHHLAVALLVGFGGPLLLGFMVGRPLGFLLWGGLIRVVFVHHATFFINSLAHMWGSQPYSRADTSRDSWWLALLTNGEGYHNFHHRFPSDYRNGVHWYQWDPTKWTIAAMRSLGLTRRLHRVSPHLILKARLEIEMLDAEKRLKALPAPAVEPLRERMIAARVRFDQALTHWAETRARYWDMKKAALQDSDLLRQCKAKMKVYEDNLQDAREHWRDTLRGLRRLPALQPAASSTLR